MRPVSNSRRRARPLLGTFVEIWAAGAPAARLDDAIDAAFAAIAEVHRLMSFHTPGSDVTRINRLAVAHPITVHPWTSEVLATALDLHRRSGGAFDVTVAPMLQRRGLVPSFPSRPALCRASASSCDRENGVDGRDKPGHDGEGKSSGIELLEDGRVLVRAGIAIDLGGIAKGFAVDRAKDALLAHGVEHGLINAGGDLTAFGAPATVALRDPRSPTRLLGEIKLQDAALASSGASFDPIAGLGATASAIIDPRRCAAASAASGVTVRASSCIIADALTKLVMILGEEALPVLREERASALLVTQDGELRVTEDWPDAVHHAA